MPELPEVETTRRDLEREVVGHRVERARVWQTRMMGGQTADALASRVEERVVQRVDRHGKFLFLRLDSGDSLLIHRGMTGNLYLVAPDQSPQPHIHLTLSLDDGREVRLHDPRGFGELRLLSGPECQSRCAHLGPDALGPGFSVRYLAAEFSRRTALVKALLLNQSFVAGLGNIYVDEALWAAALHPVRRAHTLSVGEIRALHGAVRKLLAASLAYRGVTFDDHRDLYGEPGGYAPYLQVFHRAGQPCPRCGEPIRLIRAAGRGSSICPACQVVDSGQ